MCAIKTLFAKTGTKQAGFAGPRSKLVTTVGQVSIPDMARCMACFLPCGSVVKNLPADVEDTGDAGLIPGSGRLPRRRTW